jgi:uncharacterized protein involved in tolerance to divalent cations
MAKAATANTARRVVRKNIVACIEFILLEIPFLWTREMAS